MFDTIIVGGGAAGLATAIMLKKQDPKLNVAVIEQLDRVGKKLSVTGNGRCNITNKSIEDTNYYSTSHKKAMEILKAFSLEDTKNFFSSIGVEICFENNKAYPRSFQASSVVDALRFALQKLNVKLFTSTKVFDIKYQGGNYTVLCENSAPLKAKAVVIATGGLAGGNKLGSNGDGYKFLEKFGHNVTAQSPVIVQIKTENSVTKTLKGIKVNAAVTVQNNQKTICSDYGEVLFCDYGLSGPPVLQLSRHCKNGCTVVLDIFNELTADELYSLILKRRNVFNGIPLTEFFAGLLHKRIGQAILKQCGIALSNSSETLTNKDCRNIATTLKEFKFNCTGNTGFVNAQATSGGADLKSFNDSLMSKSQAGLFAVGEVLDVDGDCGGYNLQWAWSSAKTVANALADFLG